MKILFLTTAHNSLSQRLEIELKDRGNQIVVALAKDDLAMLNAAAEALPDIIVAPMLKTAIPDAVCAQYTCLIVHPGIKGDRGGSSLDWAIMNREKLWGVTVLQATAEWDAGPVWAYRTFPVPASPVSKSRLYRQQVTEAAVQAVLEAVEKFRAGAFKPEPLDYAKGDVLGRFRPIMRQPDRAIDWERDATDVIVAKINAADSAPGVLDTHFGAPFFLYGAHPEDRLRGAAGQLLAKRDGAVCVGAVDGAVWLTHVKPKGGGGDISHRPARDCEFFGSSIRAVAGVKLPATLALGERAAGLPHSSLPVDAAPNYRTFQEIRYVEDGAVGRLFFDFYNGAMSTRQCTRLRDAFLYARSRPTRVIELLGGEDFFSNGIHLNVIEAAQDPALESWRNINAMNDLVLEILTTMSHLVIAGLRGNAGAGGAILALAADQVYAREGVVLNPHYKGMGGLYGSEYWTYLLAKRVGPQQAAAITDGCKPMGMREARTIGFIDDCFGANAAEFGRPPPKSRNGLRRARRFGICCVKNTSGAFWTNG